MKKVAHVLQLKMLFCYHKSSVLGFSFPRTNHKYKEYTTFGVSDKIVMFCINLLYLEESRYIRDCAEAKYFVSTCLFLLCAWAL
jgi:hypothetical protein